MVEPRLASDMCSYSFKCRNFQSDMLQDYCQKKGNTCDGVCNSATCSDEKHCNGFTYGNTCGIIDVTPMDVCLYGWPWICRAGEDVYNTSDSNRCNNRKDDTIYCPSLLITTMLDYGYHYTDVPLFNFTRCSTILWSVNMWYIIPQEYVRERYESTGSGNTDP